MLLISTKRVPRAHGLGEAARAVDVDAPEGRERGVVRAGGLAQHVHARGEVYHRVDTRERRAPRRRAVDLPDPHELDAGDRDVAPHGRAHLVSVGEQPAHHRRTDEPGRTGAEHPHRARLQPSMRRHTSHAAKGSTHAPIHTLAIASTTRPASVRATSAVTRACPRPAATARW